jgi:short-subunit dehydrogenase
MARQLVEAGHEVWGVARRGDQLEELRQQLNSSNFHYSVCDIKNEEAVRKVQQEMVNIGYFPSTFVLNAAVEFEEPLPHLSEVLSRETLRTNLEGALIWISLFIDHCLVKENCQFIAVSSLFAHWPDTSSVAYAASKAGLSMAFRSLRLRYRKYGVLFKIVYLGPIDTGINPRFVEQAGEKGPRWVVSPESASRFVIKSASTCRHMLYYPWYVFVLIKFFGWLPDGLFETITRSFKR